MSSITSRNLLLRCQVVVGRVEKVESGEPAGDTGGELQTAVGRPVIESPRVIWSLILMQVLLIWIKAFQLCHFDFPLSVEIHVGAEEHEAQSGCVGGHGTHVNVN